MTLQELCARFGFQPSAAERLFPLVRPSIRLTGVDYQEVAANRLGGRPNLPPGVEWPAFREQALGFVAQLDLASLPQVGRGAVPEWAKGLAAIALPSSGALYFFFAGTDGSLGGGPEEWRVLYSEEPLAQMPLREWPGGFEELFKLKPVRLAVEFIEPTMPGNEDPVLSPISFTTEESQMYEAMNHSFYENRPRPAHRLGGYPDWMKDPESQKYFDERRPFGLHRIGGYPDYIQHDPKAEAEQLAPSNGSGWELLFQVDSEEAAGISWGDLGRLYFLIRPDDLLCKRFENTWMVADCY
jgi:uncharacterized protein YwqG